MEKQIREKNKTSDNASYLVDNEKSICQHRKLYQLTARKEKFISETIYADLEGIIQQDSHIYINPQENEGLTTQKWTNDEI